MCALHNRVAEGAFFVRTPIHATRSHKLLATGTGGCSAAWSPTQNAMPAFGRSRVNLQAARMQADRPIDNGRSRTDHKLESGSTPVPFANEAPAVRARQIDEAKPIHCPPRLHPRCLFFAGDPCSRWGRLSAD